MWTRPALSIALLTYNRSPYLKLALEGILAQTWGDFELLVLDNASTDDTAETVLAIKDPRLTYVRQPPGKLSGYNWASAVWMARGDALLVTHDDDLLEPTMISRQMAAFQARPQLSAVATNVSLMDEAGRILQPRLYPWTKDRHFERGDYLRAFLEEKLWVPMQTCLFRRAAMARLVGLQQAWKPASRLATLATGDILNAIQLNHLGDLLILEEPLLRYRQHPSQEGRGVDQSHHMIELFRILRRAGRTNAHVRPHLPLVEARLARYLIQDKLLQTREAKDLSRLKRQVLHLLSDLESRLPSPGKPALLLPLAILARLLDAPLPAGMVAEPFRMGVPTDPATEAFMAWWVRLSGQDRGLFPAPGPVRRVAVLGSLLAAGLVALDAQRASLEVACFLDSSPARQGERLLGVTVHPPAWLEQHGRSLDAIILSSEGQGEAGIRAMLQSHLGPARIPILSWKDLATADMEAAGAPLRGAP
jgi:hypothetical protein